MTSSRGTTLHPVEDQRWARCDIKSTNLLAAVLAKEEAWEAGAGRGAVHEPARHRARGRFVERLRGARRE